MASNELSNFLLDVCLEVDNREHKLLELIQTSTKFQHTNTVLKSPAPSLPLGDMILKVADETVLVMERKTLRDLLASVKDGRYRDQKVRLLKSYPREMVLYILEGGSKQNWSFSWTFESDPSDRMRARSAFSSVEKKIMMSSFVNTLVRDRIGWVFTEDLEDTAAFLEQLVQRVRENPDVYCPSMQKDKQQAEDTNVRPLAKKDLLTPSLCFIAQLAQIPGLSLGKARVIADTLGVHSMTELITKVPDLKESLQNVQGIGKKIAQTVCTFLGVEQS